jgi:hypothetical protein
METTMTLFEPEEPFEFVNQEQILEALRLWHGGDPSAWPLDRLRLRLKVLQDLEAHGSLAEAGTAAQNRAVLNLGLEMLRGLMIEAHDLLRDRFENRRDFSSLSNQLNLSESALHYRQRQAVKQLTDCINRLEFDAAQEWRDRILACLGEPSYQELIGVEERRQELREALLAEDTHFVLALTGLGGLGKTALAHRTARDMVTTMRFDNIGWVTAKQTHLSTMGRLQHDTGQPALTFSMLIDRLANQFSFNEKGQTQLQRQRLVKNYLRDHACLVIIDNLETVADYDSLLPELRRWQRPSKFLLTSRIRLIDQTDVFSLSLTELNPEAAYQLIRAEAERSGFHELAQAPEASLAKVYKAVGGNPLALKLIIGQLRFFSLPEVLERFSGRGAPRGEGLFDYIYSEIWDRLADNRRDLLLLLTEAGETGFTLSHIAAVSQLPPSVIVPALEDLILLSLVDVGGNLAERRYRLHRLTETFLLRMFDAV